MQRIHAMVGIVQLATGDYRVECACGDKRIGDDEDEAFEDHGQHKVRARAAERDA